MFHYFVTIEINAKKVFAVMEIKQQAISIQMSYSKARTVCVPYAASHDIWICPEPLVRHHAYSNDCLLDYRNKE